MRPILRLAAIAARFLLFVPIAATGQQLLPPTPEPAEVMIVGTYHFANPGLEQVVETLVDGGPAWSRVVL